MKVYISADIEGVHAQVLRVDHEYFLAPRGPVTVNGAPVSRPPFRETLEPDDLVIVSQSGDKASAENAAAVAPGRAARRRFLRTSAR
mgnify:CR=1 FL=1